MAQGHSRPPPVRIIHPCIAILRPGICSPRLTPSVHASICNIHEVNSFGPGLRQHPKRLMELHYIMNEMLLVSVMLLEHVPTRTLPILTWRR